MTEGTSNKHFVGPEHNGRNVGIRGEAASQRGRLHVIGVGSKQQSTQRSIKGIVKFPDGKLSKEILLSSLYLVSFYRNNLKIFPASCFQSYSYPILTDL